MKRVTGKVALVTGGAMGMGKSHSELLAAEGAKVFVCDIDVENGNQVVEAIRGQGGDAEFLRLDVSSEADWKAAIKSIKEKADRLDILVNNAAHQMHFDTFEDIPDTEWERTFRTNIHAMFYLSKAAAPLMKDGGAIINTASINSDKPNPGLLAYATTKGAIQNFTVGLAQMLAPRGIRVNCVAPGPVWTPLIPATLPEESVQHFGENYPIGRPAQPAELATAFVMLADPLSSYTAGATVAVVGGQAMM